MPPRIRWFVWITLLNVAITWAWVAIYRNDFELITYLRAPVFSPPETIDAVATRAYVALAVATGIQLVLMTIIALRQGWARWILLLWCLACDLPCLGCLYCSNPPIPFEVLVKCIGTALDFIALYLIFSKPARAWFRKPKPQS
ncbi:hypothetical protein [Rhizomicrobium electricum]|uniref:DUF2569 domain-containing protein n=1 Tax=Rhizomicrobium electricum TaxID=480070 RepID=A0ABN1F8S1_9PROT|nr:hypothetical protein [Rhizomicrobium electricum]NIJ46750.1 hypothetical protein [Rhizomicrobium electricum]